MRHDVHHPRLQRSHARTNRITRRLVLIITDARNDIDPAQQLVNPGSIEQRSPFLRRDETIFHRVREFDTNLHADDTRRTLQRMRRAHAGLECGGIARCAVEGEQAVVEHACLGPRFFAEEIDQRRAARVVRHPRLRFKVSNNASASSRPTVMPRHGATARVCAAAACESVAGGGQKVEIAIRCTPST